MSRRAALLMTAMLVLAVPASANDWRDRYDFEGGDDVAVEVVEAASQVYVLATCTNNEGLKQAVVVRWNAVGQITGTWEYGSGQGDVEAVALAVRANQDSTQIFVAAGAYNGFNWDCVTLKFDGLQSQSAPLWQVTYHGGQGNDRPCAMVLTDDAVIVTGHSLGQSTGDDFLTIAYTRAGSQLWVARSNRQSNSADTALAVSFGDWGNDEESGTWVFVTGVSGEANNPTGAWTIALDPDDGLVENDDYYSVSGVSCRGSDLECIVDDNSDPEVCYLLVAGQVRATPSSKGKSLVLGYTAGEDGVELDGSIVIERGHHMDFRDMASVFYIDDDDDPHAFVALAMDSANADHSEIAGVTALLDFGGSSFNLVWSQPGPEAASGNGLSAINMDDEVNIYVAGNRAGDIVGMRYDPQGALRYDATPGWAGTVAADLEFVESPSPGFIGWMAMCGTVDGANGRDVGVCRVDVPREGYGWIEKAPVPRSPSGRPIKDGGWLVYDELDHCIYAAKGNKTGDFYCYARDSSRWSPLASWPCGSDEKLPRKGSVGVSDGNGTIYATKGNNRTGFWKYTIEDSTWTQLTDVPLGLSNKKVKGGTDLAYVVADSTPYIYLLKGYKCEFYRYNISTGTWQTLPDAPTGAKGRWSAGSWLAYDGTSKLYAHKAKYHELYAYDIATSSWSPLLQGLPWRNQQTGKDKKSKDGGSAAVMDGLIFALKGGGQQDIYCYAPAQNRWTELDTIPRRGSSDRTVRIKQGGDIVTAEDLLYVIKGGNSWEFWRYLPRLTDDAQDCLATTGVTGGSTFDSEEAIFDGYEAERPRWNSSGTAVVYHREDSASGCNAIYFVAGGDEKQLTFEPTDCENPVFRPNGSEVAFQMYDTTTERYQICFVNSSFGTAAGSAEEVESGETAPADAETAPGAGAGLSAENTAPAITAAPVRSRPRVAGGSSYSSIYQLTFDDRDHENPEWSPDGEWLVCQVEDTTGYTQLMRLYMDGSYEEQLTFDEADHEWPKYLNDEVLVYQHSPDTGYDQVCKLYIGSAIEVQLTDGLSDYEKPDPAANCSSVVFQGVDDDGDYQIGHVLASGTNQYWLTSGDRDIEEPDISPDNITVYGVRWQGLTSEIGWADISGTGNGFEAITDDDYIRDNPDVAYNSILCSNSVIYERENPSPTYGDGPRRRKPGTGIYMTKHKRKPNDGEQTAAGFRLALERAEPNPARTALTIHWQVPTRQPVSLRVYNTAGRLVRVLEEGERAPGRYSTRWNGRDDEGRRLAAGVYFYALEAGERRLSRKVVLAE